MAIYHEGAEIEVEYLHFDGRGHTVTLRVRGRVVADDGRRLTVHVQERLTDDWRRLDEGETTFNSVSHAFVLARPVRR